ncbi:uncharacterized protein RHO25_007675 [Cercospora beticola]|uniref:F-box domain-containing protein n=1 Tax=Cercospora beticola TaxID=122368 RepID=A0ABZ0NTZ0_CERBT|nr:hypothetical protein RHO25_007675 [Cercospora beticola]
MNDLTSRVQSLPPELFSRIYELVTAIEPELMVDITSYYRPPAILQLDRSSREHISQEYYGRDTVFRFANENQRLFLPWLRSIPTRFRVLIGRVEVGHEQDYRSAWKQLMALALGTNRVGLPLTGCILSGTYGLTMKRVEYKCTPPVEGSWTEA